MKIIMTGTPGVGKSTLAKLLAKQMNIELISLSRFAKENKLVDKNSEVDIKKLSKKLSFLKNKSNYILEGHLACEIPLPADFVFVLRSNPKILSNRLKKRKYSKEKIEENVMSEILDYCLILCEKNYQTKRINSLIVQINTSKRPINSCLKIMTQVIKGKKTKGDRVQYSLKDYLVGGLS